MKLVRVVRTSRIIDRWQSKLGLRYTSRTLILFFFTVMLTCHWCACLWVIAATTTNEQSTWVHEGGFETRPVAVGRRTPDVTKTPMT